MGYLIAINNYFLIQIKLYEDHEDHEDHEEEQFNKFQKESERMNFKENSYVNILYLLI